MHCKNRGLIPHIKPKYLLLIAGIVWFIAGANVFNIGVSDFINSWHNNHLYLLGSFAVYLIFVIYIFRPLVVKHNARISEMRCEKVPFYLFFDKKNYIIMVYMITLGVLLRSLQLLPSIIIGFFYCGIGGALITAGILFLQSFFLWD